MDLIVPNLFMPSAADTEEAMAAVYLTCGPTLVMYPDRGHFFEAEQGIAFFRSLSKGELAIFPKCGHNIFEHYPDLYAQTAVAFMKRFRPNIA